VSALTRKRCPFRPINALTRSIAATVQFGAIAKHRSATSRCPQQDQQQYYQQPAAYQQPVAAPPVPASAAASSGGSDPIAQLKQLADLTAQGVLTDEEFAAAKAKILAA
jgi:Short C-terminal domain